MAMTAEASPVAAAGGDGERPTGRRWGRRVVGAAGRLMITSGVVLLLLVAYQLWGTNLQTSRSQDRLADEFEQALADAGVVQGPRTTATTATTEPAATTTTEPRTSTPSTAPAIPPPAIGDVVGKLSIPAVGVRNFYFVQGTGIDQLKRGAAHYEDTPLPGQAGNAAIAGHRTTWGAPFHNIEKMQPGDVIEITTQQGTFRYEMFEQLIVGPLDTYVLDDVGDNRLTLTACHPKFSSKQRIVIHAKLVGTPVEKLPGQDEAAGPTDREPVRRAAIDEFESEPILRFPGAWWGLVCMAAWAAVRVTAWALRRSSLLVRAVPYVIGTPICLVLLYLFFEAVSYEAVARALHV
jgi:sortase A